MNEPGSPKRRRGSMVALVSMLAVVVAAFLVVGIVSASGQPTATATSPVALGSPSAGTAPSASSVAPSSSTTPPAVVRQTAKPTPQPTQTAELTQTQPIKKALTVRVTKVEAVKGIANGPGEIGGPSVRFTIEIDNSTGRSVALSDTVVNAFYGKAQTPANSLEQPDGQAFPGSVKNGRTATGVFIFNIPTAERSDVVVTVDTAVSNPVVAFKGAAPE